MKLVNTSVYWPLQLLSLYHYTVLCHALLIQAVCRTCVTYETSKLLSSLTISVSVSLYSTLSSLPSQQYVGRVSHINPVNGSVALPSVSLYHYTVLCHALLIQAVFRTCDTYEPIKWLSSLTISFPVSLYSTLSSYLILAVCRTCVTYEPSKWLSSLTISVCVSLYSTLSSFL